jgi:hypothetical protein
VLLPLLLLLLLPLPLPLPFFLSIPSKARNPLPPVLAVALTAPSRHQLYASQPLSCQQHTTISPKYNPKLACQAPHHPYNHQNPHHHWGFLFENRGIVTPNHLLFLKRSKKTGAATANAIAAPSISSPQRRDSTCPAVPPCHHCLKDSASFATQDGIHPTQSTPNSFVFRSLAPNSFRMRPLKGWTTCNPNKPNHLLPESETQGGGTPAQQRIPQGQTTSSLPSTLSPLLTS